VTKGWAVIAALVPGRTKTQCNHRWHDTLDPSIDRANGRTGKWEEDEDSKLKDAIQTHGDKDWVAILSLVPGRTRHQCYRRWNDALKPSIGRANARKGKWTGAEDSLLRHAVQTRGDKDRVALSALIPGRTTMQCRNRWKYKKHMDPHRSTTRGTEHITPKKAHGLGQDTHSP
jgi:hypothetical protein